MTAGDGDSGAQVNLAARIAAAQEAAAGPRQRLAALEAELSAALEQPPDYAAASRLQEQLPGAREAAALAEVELRVLTEAQAALEQERQATARRIAEAQQLDQAERMLEAARAAEQQALDDTRARLAVMRSHLAAARGAWDEARRIEAGVLQARRQGVEARRLLGEWPSTDPGPAVVGSSECQVMANTDRLVRELAKWRPE